MKAGSRTVFISRERRSSTWPISGLCPTSLYGSGLSQTPEGTRSPYPTHTGPAESSQVHHPAEDPQELPALRSHISLLSPKPQKEMPRSFLISCPMFFFRPFPFPADLKPIFQPCAALKHNQRKKGLKGKAAFSKVILKTVFRDG